MKELKREKANKKNLILKKIVNMNKLFSLIKRNIIQHPIMCHPLILASAQIHGQQCFLSAKRSLVHLISAMMLAPSVSKAAAQFLTVISISAAHSTTNDSVHSVEKIYGISGWISSLINCFFLFEMISELNKPIKTVAESKVMRKIAIVFVIREYWLKLIIQDESDLIYNYFLKEIRFIILEDNDDQRIKPKKDQRSSYEVAVDAQKRSWKRQGCVN